MTYPKKASIFLIMEGSYAETVFKFLSKNYSCVGFLKFNVIERVFRFLMTVNGITKYKLRLIAPRSTGGRLTRFLLPLSQVFILLYLFLIPMLVSRRLRKKFDVCIACSWYAGLCALALKRIGIMKKVVYWCLDWFPSVPIAKVGIYNAILNNVIFPKVDRIVAERADACWNLVEAIMTARQTSNPNLFLDNNKVVNPPFAYGNSLEFQGERYSISFFGQIVPKRGLELAIDAISHLKVKGRKIKLEIIGSPPSSEYGKYLREYAKTRGVSDDVFFWGFRPENEIPRIMKHSFAGLAIFQGQPDNSNYTFPAKVIKYLENGVPVIVTKDAFIANEIITNSLGIAINGSLDDLIQAIEKLSSAETMKFFQRKISLYVKKMSRCEQLSKALEELLESRAR